MLISLKSLIGSTSQDDYRILVTIYIYLFDIIRYCYPYVSQLQPPGTGDPGDPLDRHRCHQALLRAYPVGLLCGTKSAVRDATEQLLPGEPHRGRG